MQHDKLAVTLRSPAGGKAQAHSARDNTELLVQIAFDAAQGHLLPAQLQVSLRLRQVLEHPDCEINDVVRLLQTDPLLSARVVALANLAAFNTSQSTVADVRTAVHRLGLMVIRMLTVSEIGRQLSLQVQDRRAKLMATQLWNHSVHVASLAYVVARRVTRQNHDAALFAGIIHELGAAYMLFRAKDYPVLLELSSLWLDPASSDEEGESDHAGIAIARAVFAHLKVPDSIVCAIEHLWRGHPERPPASLGDTLLLAHELAPIVSPFSCSPQTDHSARRARVELAADDAPLSEVIEEYSHEVESIVRALGADVRS